MSSSISLADHIQIMRDDESMSQMEILKLYGRMGDSIATALCETMLSEETRHIYHALTLDQVRLISLKKGKGVDPYRPSTYGLQLDAEDTYLTRDMTKSYTRSVFRDWDAPFLEMLFDTEEIENIVLWSPEMLLMRYIADVCRTGRKKPVRATWMEEWARRSSTRKLFGKKVSILWHSLPRIVAYVQNNPSYVAFERKMVIAARMVCDASEKERYALFKRKSKLREFFDALKTRMHLPMLYGRYVMAAMVAARYTKKDIVTAIQNPTKVCKPLRDMLVFYWFQLLSPYDNEFIEGDELSAVALVGGK
jgi:hypothetical protein